MMQVLLEKYKDLQKDEEAYFCKKADLYSLGMVCAYLLSGKNPEDREDLED